MAIAKGPADGTGSSNYAHLLHPNRKWNKNKRLMMLHVWIFLVLITSYGNGYDSSMMNGVQLLTQWTGYFSNPHGGNLSLLNVIQTIGAFAAYPFAPYLSDGIGRRRTIWLGAVIVVASAAIQTASHNIGMFIAARFMAGFGVTFCMNSAPLFISELAYPPYRVPLTSLSNALWYIGSFVAGWVAYRTFKIQSTWAWRIPSALQALPFVALMFLLFFAPESPRWLVSRGRDAEAIQTLAYYHSDGDQSDALVQYEYKEIKAALAFDREIAANVGYKSFIATPGNRRRIRIVVALAFFTQLSGTDIVPFYFDNAFFETTEAVNPHIQLLISGIIQIWTLFWAVLPALLSERLGRRLLFITSGVAMLVFLLFQTVSSAEFAMKESQPAAHAVIASTLLFNASYFAFTTVIIAYIVEILPYPLRAKGFNVFNFISSVGLIFNQYVNPIAFNHLRWKYYIPYVFWLAFELAFLVFFVVETKGRTLEEAAAVFDGTDALDHIAGHAVHEAHHDGGSDEKLSATP